MSDTSMFMRFPMQYIDSNMYIACYGDRAIVIDPNISNLALCKLRNIAHIDIFLTHEHADHTSGVNFLKRNFSSVTVFAHPKCAEKIINRKNNRAVIALGLLTVENNNLIKQFYKNWPVEDIHVDRIVQDRESLIWCDHLMKFIYAPGHSPGSLMIMVDDEYLFSGDYMIAGTPVILRYPGGSEKDYYERTLPVLKGLSGNIQVLPGHGKPYMLSDFVYRCDCFSRRRTFNEGIKD